jgi:hypothetical protein
MNRFRCVCNFRRMRVLAACLLACFCTGLFAALPLLFAADPAATPQKKRSVQLQSAARSGWNFSAPDRRFQNARWRESIGATLEQTTFAPSAPAGRYLKNNGTLAGKRLPPAHLDDLDKMRPPENRQLMLGGSTPVHGEFTKERTGWRAYNDADIPGVSSSLKEERRAAAYAGFHPGEDVELKVGPEYQLGSSVTRPEQTGHAKDGAGTLGMGMKLKIDF